MSRGQKEAKFVKKRDFWGLKPLSQGPNLGEGSDFFLYSFGTSQWDIFINFGDPVAIQGLKIGKNWPKNG